MTDTLPYAAEIKWRAEKWAEGVAALSVLSGMRSCAAGLEALTQTDDPLLHTVLFSGIVVNYARAFEEVKDKATGTARRFSTRKLSPPFNKDFHQALLTLRNEQIAHVGHGMNDYDLTFMIAKVTVETPQPDGSIKQDVNRHVVGTRARASLACGPITVQDHDDLLAHVRALEAEAGQQLSMAMVEHDVASLFRLEELAKGSESHTKTLKSKQFAPSIGGLLVMGEEDLAFSLAKSPTVLPLAFAVMHYRVVEQDGTFTLKGSSVVE